MVEALCGLVKRATGSCRHPAKPRRFPGLGTARRSASTTALIRGRPTSGASLPDHLRPIPPPPWGNPRPALPLRLRSDLACPALLLRDARAPVPFVTGTRPLLLRSYRAFPPPHSRTPERLSHRRPPHAPTLAVLYLYPAIRISPVPRGSLNTPAPHRLHLPGRIQ